ncbi:MAG TPA: Ppx/GppA phosphatase family protein [Acidimicrobiia bacterium]|nr:Ppx/GppA phosphatase family protein [Acidimicrobiia bacterium]
MVEGIVPRWEWRTFGFGAALDAAERRLGAMQAEKTQDSDEVYLLSVHNDTSCKLRASQLDVKQLQAVNADDLELWKPIMKADFPLTAADATTVFNALSHPVPALARATYTLEQFAELIEHDPRLCVVGVHKTRTHYLVDDCMVEKTVLATKHGAVHTIAIESPDPGLVLATIAKLGLDGRRNVNVPRGLKTLAHFDAQRYAVIDIGTNSVKFHLGEVRADGTVRTIADRADVTRLGEGLDEHRRLDDAAMARTADAVVALFEEARHAQVAGIVVVGTAGLRSAENREEFDELLKRRIGVTVEIISGEQEGRLAYVAAISALPLARGQLVVFDSGGGSTQFTFGRGADVSERFSVDIGAVRITERCGLAGKVTREQLDDALTVIATELQRLDGRATPDSVVGMGGTLTNLAAVHHQLAEYDPEIVHGTVLDLAEIDRQIERYRTLDASERRTIVGLQPNRAEVILGGACIVRTILAKLGRGAVTVTDRGVRHGLFIERFAEA